MSNKTYASNEEFVRAYIDRTQAELTAYAARIGNGAGLLRDLKGWESNYAPTIGCDVHSLIDALPVQARPQYIQAVAARYNQRGVTTVLRDMTEAGVRLQSGIYGVDQPDSATIRRGLAYMRNVFARDGVPDARLSALEHAVVTQREPLKLPVPREPSCRLQPRSKMDRATFYRAESARDAVAAPRLSFAEQLQARFGSGREGR